LPTASTDPQQGECGVIKWSDDAEQKRFRDTVRTFIRDCFPLEYRPDRSVEFSLEPEDAPGYNWAADRQSPDEQRRKGAIRWAEALAGRGWITPHWPREYGGAQLGVLEEFILHEEMMRAGVPPVNGIGAFLLGPTLLAHGSEQQCRTHLPGISSGRTTWAQGFSEPDAGSDLASLRTRAERQGDHYVVSGQKVWTSLAQHADWLFLLARTDPAEPRHKGITFLLVELSSPGITIRPIVDMRGATPYAEVFFDDVRVPVVNRVGDENRGWYVAMSTLDFERSGIGSTVRYERDLDRLVRYLSSEQSSEYRRADIKETVRLDIARRHVEIRVLRNLARYNAALQAAGCPTEEAASINQLFSAELHQRLARTGAEAFGPFAGLWQREHAPLQADFTHSCFDAVAHTFLAGSSEVQRNVIATRGLGLPRS
jgi:alkylation response protein AidB-like acyl-CoA dehydrogenase